MWYISPLVDNGQSTSTLGVHFTTLAMKGHLPQRKLLATRAVIVAEDGKPRRAVIVAEDGKPRRAIIVAEDGKPRRAATEGSHGGRSSP